MMLLLSLFPGIDLLGYAFELEWPEACIVRGPDPIYGSLSDIRVFHPTPGRFDGIFGGPPCQSFSSLVHLVRANGHEPRFGNLIPEFERSIFEAKPAWFVMENVPKAPEPIVEGYGVTPFFLDNAAIAGDDEFGQEQTRVRKFCFGMRGVERPPDLRRWIDLAVFLLPDAVGTTTQWTPDNSKEAKRRHECINGSHGVPPQGLPDGFLDDVPFTADGKLKAIANGVPLPMGRAIARAIKEAIR